MKTYEQDGLVDQEGSSSKEDNSGAEQRDSPEVEYSVSGGLIDRLSKLGISFAFSSYQSSLLYMVGRNAQGGIHVHQAAMPKPMGLNFSEDSLLTMSAGTQIIQFENVLEPQERINGLFDACFVPRSISLTGKLDAHDVAVDEGRNPIFVNTRYNCLATTSNRHSFEPIWRPPFITELVDEDRCHLNGLAVENGQPRFVTAVSRSNTIDGWRDRRSDGGVVVEVESEEILCDGLSMPHSPRLYDGKLWVLNSGTGELGLIDTKKSGMAKFAEVAFCPGFVRGLAFHKGYAFVGLSKPRYKRFEGLSLDERLRAADSEPWCGVQIIDLSSGVCVDWFRIDGIVGELYDVEVLPNVTTPMVLSPGSPEAADLITFDRKGEQRRDTV